METPAGGTRKPSACSMRPVRVRHSPSRACRLIRCTLSVFGRGSTARRTAVVPAGHGGGFRRQQACLEPLSIFNGGTSETLGQLIVTALPGRLGSIHEKI